MEVAANDDAVPLRSASFVGLHLEPECSEHDFNPVPEVVTCRDIEEGRASVRTFGRLKSGQLAWMDSGMDRESFAPDHCDALLSAAYSVVVVCSTYKNRVGPEKNMIGSGLVIDTESGAKVLTARHNVLRKRRLDPEGDHELHLQKTRVADEVRTLSISFATAERGAAPKLSPRDRPTHQVSNVFWRHNADYALMSISPSRDAQEPCDLTPYVQHRKPVAPVAIGDTVFAFGFPASLSKEDYMTATDATEKLWEIHRKLFIPGVLHVSRGKVMEVTDTLVSYDANTAGGMSGGPVFRLEGGTLSLVGIHVGGVLKNSVNCFVPLDMVRLEVPIN